MEKDVKELLENLGKKDSESANLWGMADIVFDPVPEDKAVLLKIFNEEQLALVGLLVNNVVKALKWHNEYEEAHIDIREKQNTSDAKLRNHRHPLNETFSAKPEF